MKERQTITLASVFVGGEKEFNNKWRAGGMEMKIRIFAAVVTCSSFHSFFSVFFVAFCAVTAQHRGQCRCSRHRPAIHILKA
jgi:hypothetical protein